ncbi:unnamed protein product [Lampetra planeri]
MVPELETGGRVMARLLTEVSGARCTGGERRALLSPTSSFKNRSTTSGGSHASLAARRLPTATGQHVDSFPLSNRKTVRTAAPRIRTRHRNAHLEGPRLPKHLVRFANHTQPVENHRRSVFPPSKNDERYGPDSPGSECRCCRSLRAAAAAAAVVAVEEVVVEEVVGVAAVSVAGGIGGGCRGCGYTAAAVVAVVVAVKAVAVRGGDG